MASCELRGKRYLIHDRDPLFTEAFRAILRATGITCLKLPPQSPNLNAVAERFVLSIKSECLDKLVPLGERHLRLAISVASECNAVQAAWKRIEDASASPADRCSTLDSLEPPILPVTMRSPGIDPGGSVDAHTGSFRVLLDRTIRTAGASLAPP
jgi:transposase InsO family protein